MSSMNDLFSGTVNRREFLSIVSAPIVLGALGGCIRPINRAIPYVHQPEGTLPGEPRFFSSTLTHQGYGRGVLVETHLGRPTKIEGNPDHPASLGATDAFMQAAVLDLYDPDRSKYIQYRRENHSRPAEWGEILKLFEKPVRNLRILTGHLSSPTLIRLIKDALKRNPGSRWLSYEPVSRGNVREGARLAFGTAVEPVYDFSNAEYVLSLDSDFLTQEPGALRYAHDFVIGRERSSRRLDVFECSPSLTGAHAESRTPLRFHQIAELAQALSFAIVHKKPPPLDRTDISRVLTRLNATRGRNLILAGDWQPAEVHAQAHLLNAALGNIGTTVRYLTPTVPHPSRTSALAELCQELKSGQVSLLLMVDSNPAYTAPADLEFSKVLKEAASDRLTKIHAGLYFDETAELCDWHIPLEHELESWCDARAFDGTASLLQPLIEPIFKSVSRPQLLAAVAGVEGAPHTLVRKTWAALSEKGWHESLRTGVIPNSRSESASVKPRFDALIAERTPGSGFEIILRPDPTIHDGRHANNAWLQELPKPLSKLVWDNALLISPKDAKHLGVQNGDIVQLSGGTVPLQLPVWLHPGQPDNTATLHLGYGRWSAGSVARGHGFNAYPLLSTRQPFVSYGHTIAKLRGSVPLVTTQTQSTMLPETKESFIRRAPTRSRLQHPMLAPKRPANDIELANSEYKWGMSINLNACIGCSACVIACQAENNIPVVGKDQCARGRNMHWLRIDRYYADPTTASAKIYFQPVPCMHCETAPCELVCPTGATSHDDDGINNMVYNRCVGTRYCSNNCPYKVRRFNFLKYVDDETESLKFKRNPNVSVRSRGVMEKCTYCIQRIQAAKISARNQGRAIVDGEIKTACQASCPTQAIVFGNLGDPSTEVSRLRQDPRTYGMLEELNTRPRTTYLARVEKEGA